MTDVAVAAGGADWEREVVAGLERVAGLQLVRRCVDLEDLLALVDTGAITVALIDPRVPGLDLDAVDRLNRAGVRVAEVRSGAGGGTAPVPPSPSAAAIGITDAVDPGRLSVLGTWSAPSVDDGESSAASPASAPGRLIVVWGPEGAPGRSTVALTLAAATAAAGESTVLIDADTRGGSLAQQVAVLDEVAGLLAACRSANEGRVDQVADHLLSLDDRLHLLTGIPRADLWPQVRVAAVEQVVRRLRREHAVLVADIGPGLGSGEAVPERSRDQVGLHLLHEADQVIVVGRADPVGLSRVIRALAELREAVPGVEPLLVLNHARSTIGWRDAEMRATVRRLSGIEPSVFLPSDQAALDTALVHGRTPRRAAPSSPFVARVEALVTSHLVASAS